MDCKCSILACTSKDFYTLGWLLVRALVSSNRYGTTSNNCIDQGFSSGDGTGGGGGDGVLRV